jgi:hypothetical protein
MMFPMAESDPRPAIIEHLTQPSVGRPLVRKAAGGDGPECPTAYVVRGSVATADPASIKFVKGRGNDERQLFAVTFDDEDNRNWFWLVAVERDPDGSWVAGGVGGGSGEIPQRSTPWLNLAAQWGQGRLYAGGQIHTAGATLRTVRLTLADGTELEDDAENNVALFISHHGEQPTSVALYGDDGLLLATHDA